MSDSVWPHRCSPPGSPVPGILQARTLEWVAISFSNAWKWKVKVKSLSHVWLFATPWTAAYQAPLSMGFSRQEYWSGMPLPFPSQYEFRKRIGKGANTVFNSEYKEGLRNWIAWDWWLNKASLSFILMEYLKTKENRKFPGSPVVKTWCFQCHGPRFNPWWGN